MQCRPEAAAKITMYTSEQIALYPEKIRDLVPRFIKSGAKCPMRIIDDNHPDMNDTLIMFEGKNFRRRRQCQPIKHAMPATTKPVVYNPKLKTQK